MGESNRIRISTEVWKEVQDMMKAEGKIFVHEDCGLRSTNSTKATSNRTDHLERQTRMKPQPKQGSRTH